MIKSIDKWVQGQVGIGRGRRRPGGLEVLLLLLAQTSQAWTKANTSCLIDGHQRLREIISKVCLNPGCDAGFYACTCCNTCKRRARGTKSIPEGVEGGASACAGNKASEMSVWVKAKILSSEIMGCGGSGGGDSERKLRDKASALMFLGPGKYEIVKSNLEKNNDHLA